MNIKKFLSQVPPAIYERGEDYFMDNAVADLQGMDNGQWFAIVEGSYDYEVEVSTGKTGDVKDYHCNCPFEGHICKHVVAVLLAIEKELPLAKDTKNKLEDWQEIIHNAPEDELRNFIKQFASKNREFRDKLVLHFLAKTKTSSPGKYIKMVNKIFHTFEDRYGYIEYRDTYAVMHPIYNLLSDAENFIAKGNPQEAFNIISAVAPACIEAIQQMDDSNGECGEAIYQSFQLAKTILENEGDKTLSDMVFKWLSEEAQNPDYNDYGCGDELEPIFFSHANNPERRLQAYKFIETRLKSLNGNNDWSTTYNRSKYLLYKVDLLKEEGKGTEANQIIDDNIRLNDFREIRINEALEKEDYNSAIQLIEDGIKIALEDNYPGIAHNLKDMLLDIYTKLKDIKNVRKIAKELFSENRSDIKYYKAYKRTFTKEEWLPVCEQIISNLSKEKANNFWGPVFNRELAAIYIEEQMWDRLFSQVKNSKNIEIVEEYSKHLSSFPSSEFLPLYISTIRACAENTGRDIYVKLVHYLKSMAKLQGGLPEAKNLENELLEKYKNRPAMKEEFNALKWN